MRAEQRALEAVKKPVLLLVLLLLLQQLLPLPLPLPLLLLLLPLLLSLSEPLCLLSSLSPLSMHSVSVSFVLQSGLEFRCCCLYCSIVAVTHLGL